MDKSNIRELLKSYYRYEKQIRYLDDEIAKLEARATKKTQTITKDPNTTPINNPRPSKVEKNALKLVDLKEKRDQVRQLYGACETLLKSVRPHQRYMIKCCICNCMSYKDFARREGLQVYHVKKKVDEILTGMEGVDL